jgi:hypothetical protein
VALQRNAVDGRFHCRVEQLDDQPSRHTAIRIARSTRLTGSQKASGSAAR